MVDASVPVAIGGIFVFPSSSFVGHILADLAWYSGISFLVSRKSRYMTGTVYRGIVAAGALLLLIFGVYFAVWSATRLLAAGVA